MHLWISPPKHPLFKVLIDNLIFTKDNHALDATGSGYLTSIIKLYIKKILLFIKCLKYFLKNKKNRIQLLIIGPLITKKKTEFYPLNHLLILYLVLYKL